MRILQASRSLLCFLLLLSPGSAQSWGDVVTTDVTLSSDLSYDGINPVGLTVAASRIRIDLNGHVVDGLDLAAIGIHVLPGVNEVTISGGFVKGCQVQILLDGHVAAHSAGHRVFRCMLSSGELGPGGLPLEHGSGVRLLYSDDAVVEECRFVQLEGSGVDGFGADRLTVRDCEFRELGLGDRGGAAGAGISLSGTDPALTGNSFTLTDGPAILLQGPGAGYGPASGGIVADNRASRCLSRPVPGRDWGVFSVTGGWSGLTLGGNILTQYQRSLSASSPSPVGIGLNDAELVRVIDNTLRGLPGTGGVKLAGSSTEIVVAGNLMAGNGSFGLEVGAGCWQIEAAFNWWGDPSGPSGLGTGFGDALVAFGGVPVGFTPWNSFPGIFGFRGSLWNGPEASGGALADLNQDGYPDLVTALGPSGTIAVHMNQSGSLVGPGPAFPAGTRLGRVVVVDLGPDLLPDIVVADPGAGAVVVLNGDGNGGMGPPLSTPVGIAPLAVVPGDVDGDAWTDLIVVDPGWPLLAGQIFLLRNDGNGGWAGPPVSLSDQGAWEDAALHDFDGDGDLDLVAADAGSLFPQSARTLMVWRNDGLGGFGPPSSHALPVDPRRLLVHDLDGDGWADIAVAGLGDAGAAGGIALYFGDGQGGFSTPSLITNGVYAPVALAVADTDLDGVLELVAAEATLGGLVSFPGPDPLLASPHGIGSGQALLEVLAADLDLDGLPDLLGLDPFHGVLDHRGVRRPTHRIFGNGCAGGSGLVPSIGYLGLAYRDNPGFVVTLSGAAPFASAYLLPGREEASDPLTGGCTMLVGRRFNPVFFAMTDANGNAERSFWLNPDAPWIQADIPLFGQWAVLDPGGGANGKWALSDALQVRPGF